MDTIFYIILLTFFVVKTQVHSNFLIILFKNKITSIKHLI